MSKKLLALTMVAFAGTSLVHAATMTRQEYNDYRGWQLPEGENGEDQGYLIEDRAGKKNTEQLNGFVLWLPKDEFDRKFKPQPKVTPERIKELLTRVQLHFTFGETPTKYVRADAWLDGSFHLATAMSKAVNPENFSKELGIEYSREDVMAIAENKLWELEGYRLFRG
ncbi:Gp49 family protein [Acinetobacter sp. YH01006]|uniref:Gp49 family protein n=1 Tax=Acinetobacter sp. YH01006 TaxID=2601022 RepID=UPI0015D339A7|nr:Gp49 family protein [Acinetobacter sp. YH01006]